MTKAELVDCVAATVDLLKAQTEAVLGDHPDSGESHPHLYSGTSLP
jgi:hypothetical protein